MVQTLSIRTKLIMAMLALVASVALMGVAADDANADGVTEIRDVQNFTPYFVYAWNHENGRYRLIFPNSAYQYNEWVPWATNAIEFNGGKYIELGFVRWRFGDTPPPCFSTVNVCPQYAIWQESTNMQPYPGDKVRYTRPPFQYTPTAPPMDGEAKAGGRRNLIIKHSLDPDGVAHMYASLEETN